MTITVAQIRIIIDGDAQGATKALSEVAAAEDQIAKKGHDAAASQNAVGESLIKVGASAKDVAIGVLAAATGFTLLAAGGIAAGRLIEKAISGVVSAAIEMNSALETASLQFKVLQGSSEKSEATVKRLFGFAKESPFELGPILQAARQLEVMGGAALNTDKTLRMVADAAAGASAPIQEVANWVGRAYSEIKSGRPFGEAAQRLQELGLLSSDARNKLEGLQKMGAEGSVVWEAFAAELDRFKGTSKELAGTWTGLTSTFSDSFKLFSAQAFKPGFDALKEGLSGINAFFDSDASKTWADDIAAGVHGVIAGIKEANTELKVGLNIGSIVLSSDAATIGLAADALGTAIQKEISQAPPIPLVIPVEVSPNIIGLKVVPLKIQDIDLGEAFHSAITFQHPRDQIKAVMDAIATLPGISDAIAKMRVTTAEAIDKNFTAEQRKQWAMAMFPSKVDVDDAAGASGAAIANAMKSMSEAWTSAQKLSDLGNAGKNLTLALRQGIATPELREEAMKQALDIGNAWKKGFDPLSKEGEAAAIRLKQLVTKAFETGSSDDVHAAEDYVAKINAAIRGEEEAKRTDTALKAQAAAIKAQQEEALRAFKQTAIYGFDTEDLHQNVTQKWGKLGSDSITALTEALSDPSKMAPAGQALRRSIGELTQLLRESGVPEWETLGKSLGDAGRQAILGEISDEDFKTQLRTAIDSLPKITAESVFNPANFKAGVLAGDIPSAVAEIGQQLTKQLAQGFSSPTEIATFQKNLGASLKLTEGIKDPATIASYTTAFVDLVMQGMASGTPEGIAAMQEGLAAWARGVNLSAAQEELARKIDAARAVFDKQVRDSGREMAQTVKASFESAFAERGGSGPGAFNTDEIKRIFSEQAGRAEPIKDLLGIDKMPAATQQMLALIDNTSGQLRAEYGKGLRIQRDDLQHDLDDRLRMVQENQRHQTEAFQDGIRDRQIADAHARQDADAVTNKQRSDEDLARQRSRQDTDEKRRLNQEILDATAKGAKPAEIASIKDSHTRSLAEQTISRGYEDKDRQIAREREAADRNLARSRESLDLTTERANRAKQDALVETQRVETRNRQLENEMSLRRFADNQANIELAKQLVKLAGTNAQTVVNAQTELKKTTDAADLAFSKFSVEPPWMPAFVEAINKFAGVATKESGSGPAAPGFFPASIPSPFIPSPAPVPAGPPDPIDISDESLDGLAARIAALNITMDTTEVSNATQAQRVAANRSRTLT